MGCPRSMSGWAREIVAQRALIVGAVTAVLHFTVVFFALPPSLESSVPASVGSLIDALGLIAAVVWARAGVTPLAAPRATDGTPLIRQDMAEQAVDAIARSTGPNEDRVAHLLAPRPADEKAPPPKPVPGH